MSSLCSTPFQDESPQTPLSTSVSPILSTTLPPPHLSTVALTPLPSPSLSERALSSSSTRAKHGLANIPTLPTTNDALEVNTMQEVRRAIDRLDEEIVTLLATRLKFIEAAARIKDDSSKVRDEWRKQDVKTKAVNKAKEVGFDAEICDKVYEALVEGCIEYEEVKWRDFRGLKYDKRDNGKHSE